MSWTATRPVAQFGLHTASSVAVRAEQGRWDDTQKKYLSNLSKQTRQRTELSHRTALSVMCCWKNAGGMILWTQRDGLSVVKNVTLQRLRCVLMRSDISFWKYNVIYKKLECQFFISENLWQCYTVDVCSENGVSSCFPFFFSGLQMSRRARKSCSTCFC